MIFTPSQKLSQDIEGSFLVLIDTSNYSDNTDNLTIDDFVSRKWELEDIDGVITEVNLPYILESENSAMIDIDKDKYLKITLTLVTDTDTYTVINETGLTRQAFYKKKLILENCICETCPTDKYDKLLYMATELITAALIDVKTYNPSGFNEKIDGANNILNSILKR